MFFCSWGALGALLGALGTLLERSWGALEFSWGALGSLLGRSWALLGAPGRPQVDLGSILELQRVDFGTSGDGFSSLRGDQGNEFPHAAPIDTLRLTGNSGQTETNKLHRF